MRPLSSVTAAYSLAHFAVDFGCAFAVCSACAGDSLCFLLYNFCAFALQMPLGLLAAFVWKWPVLAVYVLINMDEIVKLPAVRVHYRKYKWVRDLTREGETL